MGHSSDQKRPREGITNWARSILSGSAVLIRAAIQERRSHYTCMNAIETEVPVAAMPLPETHHDLEMLLEALNALNAALDQYETAEPVTSDPVAA